MHAQKTVHSEKCEKGIAQMLEGLHTGSYLLYHPFQLPLILFSLEYE